MIPKVTSDVPYLLDPVNLKLNLSELIINGFGLLSELLPLLHLAEHVCISPCPDTLIAIGYIRVFVQMLAALFAVLMLIEGVCKIELIGIES